MVEGVAEYADEGTKPYRIMINENTIKEMDTTFAGRPVYVQHVEEVDMDKLQEEADGYVIESFFNKSDGKHWARFIVVSDKGHEAIRNGWKLSNAYVPKTFANGGLWHGVEYSKEVTAGEYEHLAIVPNPRYEESIILTPEQFKSYNSEKEQELTRLANSKGDSMLKFWNKKAVENSVDFETMSVTLPKSKVERTIAQLVEDADKIQNMAGYASPDHMVKAGDEEMTVNELSERYQAMCAKNKEDEVKKNAEEEEKKKNAEMSEEDKKKNAEEEEKKKKENKEAEIVTEMKNDDDESMDNKKKNAKHFETLKNAPDTVVKDPVKVDLDKSARGKARYGSN